SGFTLKTSGNKVSGTDELIKPGSTVDMAAGTNLTVQQDANGKVTYATAKDVTFDSVKAGPVTINSTGINASNTAITGVASNLGTTAVPTNPAGTAGTSPLLNLGNTAVLDTNAATVGDLRNMGWVVSTKAGNGYVDTVKNANQVDFKGTGLAKVTGVTTADGVREITVDVNAQALTNASQLPVVYTDVAGNKVVKDPVSGNFYPANADGTPNKTLPEVPANTVVASMNNGGNSTTTPMALGNIASTLPKTYSTTQDVAGNPVTITTAQVAPTLTPAQMNTAATVGDVLNAGWNLQTNGAATDFVKPYDTVNFKDGNGTTVATTTDGKVNNVQYNVAVDNKTTQITATDKNGDTVIQQPDGSWKKAGGTVVNAGDVTGPSKVSAIAPATTTLTNVAAGSPNNVGSVAPVAPADAGKFVTAGDIANAINNSGF
ncbi:hypothetical protein ACEYX7_10890, partial [Acinetobacter sp. c1-l78]